MEEKEFKKYIESNELILADFNASWCLPCRALSEEIETVEQLLKDKVNILSVDIDSSEKLSSKYKITAVPSMIIFKNGIECEKIVGYRSSDELLEILNKYL